LEEAVKIFVGLVLVLALGLAGCGGDDGGDSAGTSTMDSQVEVGLVTDVNQLSDRGFNALAYKGMKRAERELGVKGRVLESQSAADYVPNLTSLARQGYDLVVGVGYAQGEAVGKVAQRFPETNFAIIDVDQASLEGKPENVVGLVFKEQEAGYMAGYLAALTAQREPGEDVISSVGGVKEPPVDRFIAGYQAGALKALPGVKVLNNYSQDWDDQAKCKELGLNQLAAGSRVIFQVAGGCGLGALDAAGEREAWGIGVDADQSFLGPHMLTSAMKRVDELAGRAQPRVRSRGGRRGARQGELARAEGRSRARRAGAQADRRRLDRRDPDDGRLEA
jgi:basic membrane protein A